MTTSGDRRWRSSASQDAAYDAWKHAKIVRGLQQSRDRSAMIPIAQILSELGR